VAGKKADLIMGAMLFRKALAIRLEHKPASSGSLANQLREFESVRDFVASATLASISDLPFVFLYVAVIFSAEAIERSAETVVFGCVNQSRVVRGLLSSTRKHKKAGRAQ
jgi:ABC-type protease/lipase transport system fused ATPase/permease subunit